MQLIFDFPVVPRFSFENFVVCAGNKTAYQFAQKIAAGDATENLLYVYGPEGSGKTHLLTALAAAIGGDYFSWREAESLHAGGCSAEVPCGLAERFHGCAALVLDDLHLLHESLSAVRAQARPEPPPCRGCAVRANCPKTWALYQELFGTGELVPFPV